ncbi:MAG TPA: EAL domain-containing protein [Methylophilaceae bacterium]|nr:EAL domain-containing protein [Methylophilaceae bacterium]
MKTLRALLVEDSEDDALLLLHELQRGGYQVTHSRVDTPDDMRSELNGNAWDIIYTDFSMTQISAFDALALVHSMDVDIPFIIVSGTIGEDRAVTAMKAGAHDYILKGNLKRLIPATERELREAMGRKEHRKAQETIYRLAYMDQVTGLPNRARFQELIENAVQEAKEASRCIALLLMDIDRFKEVNDTLGHDRGDVLLKQVGLRLNGVLNDGGIIARIGGDEFGILLSRLDGVDEIHEIIRKLQDFLAPAFMIDGVPVSVEASIGVAMMPEHAEDPRMLLQLADIAMYRAKQMASSYAIYEPQFNLYSPSQLGLMAELREAIGKNQLRLHYQPKLELATGRVVGLEALVRWEHPRLGLLYPDKFILTAEQTGLIHPLTRWVLLEALRYCLEQSGQGIELRMNVNLSARSLHDPHLIPMVTDALKTTGARPEQLVLEVTESAIVLDPNRAEETLVALSKLGVGLSIDDFGTGYTSLASIKRLPIQEIKIDRSFVFNMLTDNKDAMIVRSVIELGHNLGLTVVAEGIETQEVMDHLNKLACNEVQGYHICRPITPEQLLNWYSSAPWGIGNDPNA